MEFPEPNSAKGPGPTQINVADIEAVPSATAKKQPLDYPPSQTMTAMPKPEVAAPLQGFRLYAVAVGVCFGALMMSLDIAIIGTVRPLSARSPRQVCQHRLTIATGHSLHYVRVWRHLPDRLVPCRLHLCYLRHHAAGRQDGLGLSSRSCLSRLFRHLPHRQHRLRSCPQQYRLDRRQGHCRCRCCWRRRQRHDHSHSHSASQIQTHLHGSWCCLFWHWANSVSCAGWSVSIPTF